MPKMEQPYIPISCSYYDFLEEAATLGNDASIEYWEGSTTKRVISKVKTFTIEDGAEFMVLENGEQIRLDFLISFNGKPLPKSC